VLRIWLIWDVCQEGVHRGSRFDSEQSSKKRRGRGSPPPHQTKGKTDLERSLKNPWSVQKEGHAGEGEGMMPRHKNRCGRGEYEKGVGCFFLMTGKMEKGRSETKSIT